jgi:hypothetical protein
MRLPLPALVSAAALLLAGRAAPTRAESGPAPVVPGSEIRVDRLSGDPVAGRRLVALDGTKLTLDQGGKNVDVPLEDVVEVSLPTAPDPPRAWAPNEVALDLWTGESVLGELRGGDGETVEVETQLLGRVKVQIERLAAVRFLQRLSQAAEPPDLRPRKDADVVHLVGGDAFGGTLESFGAKSLRSVTPQKDVVEPAYDRVVAVTLMDDAGARPAADAAATLRVALRDGSRVAGREARLDGGRLVLESASGFAVQCALTDVVALQVASGRFAFLSDIAPATTVVEPVWEVAAGDPAVLFAPRFDRSFAGRPLRCGGRTWLDGIGVFSGTTLTWDLGGKYREFRTSAGLDDGAGPGGGVVFRVLVDGKEVWTSGFVRPARAQGRGAASPVASPRIPLEGAKTLSLVVLAGDAEDPYPVQDEADWLGPIVVRAGEK